MSACLVGVHTPSPQKPHKHISSPEDKEKNALFEGVIFLHCERTPGQTIPLYLTPSPEKVSAPAGPGLAGEGLQWYEV